tara:strand:+ start:467 stop:628 length:162 start_codon:yes stop_codon:yes gene_type:complete
MSVIIYQEHIEILEEENESLRKEITFLIGQLASYDKEVNLLERSFTTQQTKKV